MHSFPPSFNSNSTFYIFKPFKEDLYTLENLIFFPATLQLCWHKKIAYKVIGYLEAIFVSLF